MCVLKCVHQTGSTSKSKTFCFLHSNANCTFRPAIFGGEEEKENRTKLVTAEFPLNIRVHTQFIYIRVTAFFQKFFLVFKVFIVFGVPRKPPINNFKREF